MKQLFIVVMVLICTSLYSQEQTVGLFLNEEESLNGYTLFTNSRKTVLVDNCGLEVNSWESVYNPGLAVYLLEDGSLLRCNRIAGDFGGGGTGGHFERQSWDGITTWMVDFSTEDMQSHHDIAPLPNGNFLTLAWTPLSGSEAIDLGREYDADIWIEKIFEIKMVGQSEYEIVWQWSLADHLVQDVFPNMPNYGVVADHPERMDFNYLPEDQGLDEDWAHFNAIAYNEQLDQIAVSSRDFSEIWILDHSTTTAEARTSEGGNSGKGGDILYRFGNPQVYQRGTAEDQVLFGQHNIEWISDDYPNGGSLSVFNNLWMDDRSRVERWTPPVDGFNYELENGQPYGPQNIDWSYDKEGFQSSRISGVQFLSNGNALICSGGLGQFFEVTEDGDTVWDYVNPIRSSSTTIVQGEPASQNAVFRALRYPPDYPGFEGRNLVGGEPIELDPFDSDCMLTDVEDIMIESQKDLYLISNMIHNDLQVNTKKAQVARISNVSGFATYHDLDEGRNIIDCSNYPAGMYFFTSGGTTLKFVKH